MPYHAGKKKKPKKKGGKKRKAAPKGYHSNYEQGGIAKGCGAVMEEKRKVTKKF